ncbi:dynamin family protein [Apiospora aurea]|uniref:Dynamin family protein n=1 Tax=Apiospora aurea TaxID=335848 RepID=A0ABR1PSE3_9PEZI
MTPDEPLRKVGKRWDAVEIFKWAGWKIIATIEFCFLQPSSFIPRILRKLTTSHHGANQNPPCSTQLPLLRGPPEIDRYHQQPPPPHGIDHDVSLPQIVVCGDRFSGKSSVLKALSGISFPIGRNACTRFPIKLVLRRDSHVGLNASIIPHHSRNEPEKVVTTSIEGGFEHPDGFVNLIEKAERMMGISPPSIPFSNDTFRVEITGPDQPHLALVDLPGLMRPQSEDLEDPDAQTIRDVVSSYMKDPRSIILAVVSAEHDSNANSETGGKTTLAQRDKQEANFIDLGIWRWTSVTNLGIASLRSRLRDMLLERTTLGLPAVVSDIERERDACKEKLDDLGLPRDTLNEQQRHLVQISESFQRLVQSSIDGNWDDPFFEVGDEAPDGYTCRVRAFAQHTMGCFYNVLVNKGHRREIISREEDSEDEDGEDEENEEEETEREDGADSSEPLRVTREEFIEHIKIRIGGLRGCELPGVLNPLVVGVLFREQSGPWGQLTHKYVKAAWEACREFLEAAIAHVANDAGTAAAILEKIVEPSMGRILKGVREKTEYILQSYCRAHPITYNRALHSSIYETRTKRSRAKYSRTLKSFFKVSEKGTVDHGNFNMDALLDALQKVSEYPDEEQCMASDALDILEAYYQVALKRFVDIIAIEIVEVRLVSALPDIFSPVGVYKMDPALINDVLSEPEERRAARAQLTEQLELLNQAALTCSKFHSTLPLSSDKDEDEHGLSSEREHTPTDDTHEEAPDNRAGGYVKCIWLPPPPASDPWFWFRETGKTRVVGADGIHRWVPRNEKLAEALDRLPVNNTTEELAI